MRIELPDCIENDHLDNISNEFKRFLALNEYKLSSFSAVKIRGTVLQRQTGEDITVIANINKYYSRTIMNNAELTPGTKKNYRKAINHMTLYLQHFKKLNCTVVEMDNAFANGFKDYLLNDNAELNKKEMPQPSALGNVKKFRTIFNQAVNDDVITKNPFLFIKLSNRSAKKPRLNIHQIRELYISEHKLNATEILYKDIFLFSVFTGLAYVDATNLKRDCLEYRANGDVKLTVERQKTGEGTVKA